MINMISLLEWTDEQLEVMAEAREYPLFKRGDWVDGVQLLEDSVAMGLPLVSDLVTKCAHHQRMFGHMGVFRILCQDKGISYLPTIRN